VTGPGADSKLASWKTPQISLEIGYSRSVLEEIATAASAALREAPNDEMEMGGVLFGTRGRGSIHIETWRPIVCEHADGPSFRFTGRDRIELACMLELARRTEELKELQPVGWFVSHPRTGISLSASDLEIYSSFFPYLWQVALVLQPIAKAPTRAGFFVREAGGNLRSGSSYLEFAIDVQPPAVVAPPAETVPIFSWANPSPPRRRSTDLQPAGTVTSQNEPIFSYAAPVPADTASVVASPGFWSRVCAVPRFAWLWTIAIVLVLGVGGLVLTRRSPHYEPFALHVSDSHQTMQVDWDRNSPLIRTARAAVLDIRDGGKSTRYSLSPGEIQAGVMSYARQSGDVELSMTVYPPSGAAVQGFGRLLAPADLPVSTPAPVSKPADTDAIVAASDSIQLRAERDALRTQISNLEESLRKETAEKNRLQELIRILENRLNIGANPDSTHENKQ